MLPQKKKEQQAQGVKARTLLTPNPKPLSIVTAKPVTLL